LSEKINIAIIGGGIVGCWIALELSKSQNDIFLFEKNRGITQGENQSSRNSGVNHAGLNYDSRTRPLKARLCVEGNRLWEQFCNIHSLPFLRVGKLMVALTDLEEREIDLYYNRAIENGVTGVQRISSEQAREIEPNVKAISALWIPSSGIFEPTSLLRQVYSIAANQGVEFMTETEVIRLKLDQNRLKMQICYRDGSTDWITPRKVINAAGVNAVDIARMVDPDFPLTTALIRGDSMKFYRSVRQELYLRGTNVYPTPITVNTPFGPQHTVGVHLTPTFDYQNGKFVIGNTIMVGPKLTPVNRVDDFQTPVPEPEVFVKYTKFFRGLKAEDLSPNFSGVQARLKNYPDFYIARDRGSSDIIHLVGVDSPGFTAAPAIARYVSKTFG
jgi:L-2-hydroxyglutarate oxidase LhgO